MAQMTWRTTDERLARVRRAAEQRGRSMNDYVTAVLDAATDPNLGGTEAERLRERLASAGLLAEVGGSTAPAVDEDRSAGACRGR